MKPQSLVRGALLLNLALHAGVCLPQSTAGDATGAAHAIILHAAHLLDVETGRLQTPGEVRIEGERIVAVGAAVERSPGAEIIDLGGATLMPGLIDAHVHLFLHPGAEDLQTVQESVPKRTLLAMLAAHDDLMAGFTAERDMGTEGAGSADTAVRDAIDKGLFPGPRLRISGNAIDILGGHEDANDFNPAQHVLSNATYANNAEQLVRSSASSSKKARISSKSMRRVPTPSVDGRLSTPYQYIGRRTRSRHQGSRAHRRRVAVHATGEPGTLYARRPASRRSTTRPVERGDHGADA